MTVGKMVLYTDRPIAKPVNVFAFVLLFSMTQYEWSVLGKTEPVTNHSAFVPVFAPLSV
jgi:hypothetical protein